MLEILRLFSRAHHPALPPRARGAKAEPPPPLNASGVALPRSFAALLETHQTADGGVRIPPALRPYLDGLEEIALPT